MGVLSKLVQWRLKRRVKIHESYQSLFTTLEGQQVLEHICDVGFVFKTTHVSGDPYQTSLNEGKRMLALSILKFVKKDHKEVLNMLDKQIKNYEQ